MNSVENLEFTDKQLAILMAIESMMEQVRMTLTPGGTNRFTELDIAAQLEGYGSVTMAHRKSVRAVLVSLSKKGLFELSPWLHPEWKDTYGDWHFTPLGIEFFQQYFQKPVTV